MSSTTETQEPSTATGDRPIALWNRPFLTIAISNLVSRTGTVVFDVVLAWWLVERTGSAVAVGYLLAAATLPIAVLGPLSGVLVDRWNKKTVLVVTDAVSAVAAFVVVGLAYLDIVNIPVLVGAAVVLGTCTSLYKPAVRSTVPLVVAGSHLTKANSVTTNFAEATKIVGPALGAGLIPLIGVPGALLVNAVSFALSAAAQATISVRRSTVGQDKERVWDGLRAGLRYMTRQTLVRNLLLMCGLVNFFLVSFNVLLPLYVSDVLHQGSGAYSATLIAEAAGGVAITAVFLARRAKQPEPNTLAWYILGAGLSLAIIPLVPSLPALLLFAGVQGALVGAFNTLYFTYIQQVVAAEYLGRVFSVVYMVAVGAMPPAYLIFGYLGDYVIDSAFLYAGVGTMLISLPFLRLRGPVVGAG